MPRRKKGRAVQPHVSDAYAVHCQPLETPALPQHQVDGQQAQGQDGQQAVGQAAPEQRGEAPPHQVDHQQRGQKPQRPGVGQGKELPQYQRCCVGPGKAPQKVGTHGGTAVFGHGAPKTQQGEAGEEQQAGGADRPGGPAHGADWRQLKKPAERKNSGTANRARQFTATPICPGRRIWIKMTL